jgi:hypothetical protein
MTYKDPDIRAADVGVMSATWAGDARVKVTGEKDKTAHWFCSAFRKK